MFRAQDVFDFVEDLAHRIELGGNPKSAQEIRSGLGYLNGLTDGWAMFMESLEHSMPTQAPKLGPREITDLEDLLEYVRKIVYR